MLKAVTLLLGVFHLAPAMAHNSACEVRLAVETGPFAPVQIASIRMKEKSGWETKWIRTNSGGVRLLAIQRGSLLLREIDPLSGQIMQERQFGNNGTRYSNGFASAHTDKGEILIAAIRPSDRAVDLFSTNNDLALTAYLPAEARSAEVVSLNGGRDVYVIAGTINSIEIFKRVGGALRQVGKIESQAMIRQAQVMATSADSFSVAFHGSDQKVRVFNWTAQDRLEEKPSYIQLGGRISGKTLNDEVLLTALENVYGATEMNVYSGERGHSRRVTLAPVIGDYVWESNAAGRAQLAIPVRNGHRSEINRVDPFAGTVVDQLPAGDSRVISAMSGFQVNGRSYYAFVSDGKTLNFVSDNESALVNAPEGTHIKRLTDVIRLADGRQLMAVLGEGSNFSSLAVIQLSEK